MRPTKTLFAVVVLSCPSFSAIATNLPGYSCSSLGVTQLADDQAALIACLKTSATDATLVWKSMTPVLTDLATDSAHVTLQADKGNLRVGDIAAAGSGINGSVPGYGRFLLFSGGPGVGTLGNSENTDTLWMARYNSGYDTTELRVNVSDNYGACYHGVCNDKFVVGTSAGGWTPLLTVTTPTKVGIGTSDPTATLDIKGDMKAESIKMGEKQLYPFGGIYNSNFDGSCRYANPITGACSCPAGYSPAPFGEYHSPGCWGGPSGSGPEGLWADGWRTSMCGYDQYMCL